MITTGTRKVYRSSLVSRDFLTKAAAVRAHAYAMMNEYYETRLWRYEQEGQWLCSQLQAKIETGDEAGAKALLDANADLQIDIPSDW